MSQQYLRKVKLLVGDDTGQGIDLSNLRIVFDVNQWDLQTPNNVALKVYNVSDQTIEQIRTEYTRVLLQAGYETGPFGTIFDGSIIQAYRGREDNINTYLSIVGADGDEAYNFAMINKTLAAGATPKDQCAAIVGSMNSHGVTQGYTPELPGGALPRGKVLFGMSRDKMRQLGQATDTKWSIQNRQTQLVPLTGVVPGPVVVINSATGLIGIPEQTQDGIKVRVLLNPDIKMGRAIKINNKDINLARLSASLGQQVQQAFLPRVTDDGLYRTIVANHQGDTRGNDYYTDIVCVAIDDSAPQGQVVKGYG